jgi:hypothetical protein
VNSTTDLVTAPTVSSGGSRAVADQHRVGVHADGTLEPLATNHESGSAARSHAVYGAGHPARCACGGSESPNREGEMIQKPARAHPPLLRRSAGPAVAMGYLQDFKPHVAGKSGGSVVRDSNVHKQPSASHYTSSIKALNKSAVRSTEFNQDMSRYRQKPLACGRLRLCFVSLSEI